jgi:hypothetical protein
MRSEYKNRVVEGSAEDARRRAKILTPSKAEEDDLELFQVRMENVLYLVRSGMVDFGITDDLFLSRFCYGRVGGLVEIPLEIGKQDLVIAVRDNDQSFAIERKPREVRDGTIFEDKIVRTDGRGIRLAINPDLNLNLKAIAFLEFARDARVEIPIPMWSRLWEAFALDKIDAAVTLFPAGELWADGLKSLRKIGEAGLVFIARDEGVKA